MSPRDLRENCFSDTVPETPPRRRYRKVLTPKPGIPAKAMVLSEYALITRTHYQDRTSYACITAKEGCLFCKHHIEPRIKGYLAGLDFADGKECLIEMTQGAISQCDVIRLRKAPLRGNYIILTRSGKANNSPVVITWQADPKRSLFSGLKQPFDLKEAVLIMWDIPQEIVNVGTGEVVKPNNDPFFPEELNRTFSE